MPKHAAAYNHDMEKKKNKKEMEEKGESDSPTIFVIVKHPEKATGKNRFAIPYMYTLSLLLNTPDSPFTGIVLPDIATGQRRSKDTSNPILNNTHLLSVPPINRIPAAVLTPCSQLSAAVP